MPIKGPNIKKINKKMARLCVFFFKPWIIIIIIEPDLRWFYIKIPLLICYSLHLVHTSKDKLVNWPKRSKIMHGRKLKLSVFTADQKCVVSYSVAYVGFVTKAG